MTAYLFAEVKDLTEQEAFRDYTTKIGATQAMDWYNSEEYKPLKELRKRLATTNVVIMDGR